MGVATVIRGWTLAHDGHAEKGIAEILKGIDIYKTTGSGINGAQFFLSLAEAYDFTGNAIAGFKAAEKALNAIESTGERRDEADTHRLMGVLSMRFRSTQRGRPEDHLRKAIEVARHQNSKSWELRATISLAQLLRDNNHWDEASTMLTEIVGWFTEGFDTADLKDAAVLLNELSK